MQTCTPPVLLDFFNSWVLQYPFQFNIDASPVPVMYSFREGRYSFIFLMHPFEVVPLSIYFPTASMKVHPEDGYRPSLLFKLNSAGRGCVGEGENNFIK